MAIKFSGRCLRLAEVQLFSIFKIRPGQRRSLIVAMWLTASVFFALSVFLFHVTSMLQAVVAAQGEGHILRPVFDLRFYWYGLSLLVFFMMAVTMVRQLHTRRFRISMWAFFFVMWVLLFVFYPVFSHYLLCYYLMKGDFCTWC